MKLTLTPEAEKRMKARIQEQVGKKADTLVKGLMDSLLSVTPKNTGRTLASWVATRDRPETMDHYAGEGMFDYNPYDYPATNSLPVGSESNRETFENESRATVHRLRIAGNPYATFFITNVASLESIGESTLPQGVGSRAAMMDVGNIPGYDLYAHPNGDHIFDPRGVGMFSRAKEKFLNLFRKR